MTRTSDGPNESSTALVVHPVLAVPYYIRYINCEAPQTPHLAILNIRWFLYRPERIIGHGIRIRQYHQKITHCRTKRSARLPTWRALRKTPTTSVLTRRYRWVNPEFLELTFVKTAELLPNYRPTKATTASVQFAGGCKVAIVMPGLPIVIYRNADLFALSWRPSQLEAACGA